VVLCSVPKLFEHSPPVAVAPHGSGESLIGNEYLERGFEHIDLGSVRECFIDDCMELLLGIVVGVEGDAMEFFWIRWRGFRESCVVFTNA